MRTILTLLAVGLTFFNVSAQIELLSEHSSFHYRSWTRFGQMENVTADQSGTYYFFLRNNGTSPQQIQNIRFFDGANERTSEGFRVWPKTLQPGQMGFIIARGNNLAGFRGGEQIRAVISTSGGQNLEQVMTNTTSPFRISNVMPAKDYSHLKIYFRNDDTLPREMRTFFINGKTFDLAGADKSLLVGGSNIIAPNHVAILIYTQSAPMKQLMPVMMSVRSSRTGGPEEVTSAAIRLVDSKFHIGTWDSGALKPENIDARKRFRELMIDAIHGQGNFDHISKAHDDFFISSMHEVPFGAPITDESVPRNIVRTHQGKPYIRLWSVDDEPDLSGKDMTQQALRSLIYWEEDTIIPSFVNLAVQKKYNRYGWYTDIVGMDHYAAPTAPNIIPLTWVPVVGRNGEMVEALEYSEVLKFNTEPRRNWSWVQMAPGPWGQEPFDWSINQQFWLHIMGGAKSMEFFVAQTQTKERWPAQWEASRICVRQLASIRNLILEGEYANVSRRLNQTILTRALVGPEAMAVFVVNNTARFSWNGSFDPIKYNGNITPANYSVEFDIPAWIAPLDVYRVGMNGEKIAGVNLQSLGNGKYRITSTEPVHQQSHVFIISSKKDDQAPESPIYLHAVDIKDSANYTLSWDVPFDNYGIQSYDIFRNGIFYKNAGVPILELSDGYIPCPEVIWEAVAIDPSGNRSQPAVFKLPQPITITQPVIAAISPDQSANEGESAAFSITVEGAYDGYVWQYNDGSGWKDASGIPAFNGTNTATLNIPITLKAYDGWQFRCLGSTLCFGKDTSDASLLTVRTSTGIKDQALAGVELFPNPAAELIQIRFSEHHSFNRIGLTDALGRDIQVLKVVEGNLESFHLPSLPSGTYYIRLMSPEKTVLIPFIKQ
jgi:hypothetical protein